ncbi:MAG: S-adenosylmethionine:tRNA ribosyltransferase-isomerase [Actinomycetes bacterium]
MTASPLGSTPPLPRTHFRLPDELSAAAPPESRGLARDGVRLLVASGDGVYHAQFPDLAAHLRPGDLVVVNTSGTLPAAVDAVRSDGRAAVVHFSTPAPEGDWLVEVRDGEGKGDGPVRDARAGERVPLDGGGTLGLREAFPDAARSIGSRLWRARLDAGRDVPAYLAQHGRPIRYGYVPLRWPLADYQTIFATHPGSAEMPSAGRPFTDRLVTRLVTSGVAVAPVILHTGVASLEAAEPPYAEWFDVPAPTARLVQHTRASGGRVVAVGTTVTRALETVADPDGRVRPGRGWTDLMLGPDRPARVVSGLITGLHAPEASHLHLLEAVAGADLVRRCYDAALHERYLWHEFGDCCLLLP